MCESMIDPLRGRKDKCIAAIKHMVAEGLVGSGYLDHIEVVEAVMDEHYMRVAEFCFLP